MDFVRSLISSRVLTKLVNKALEPFLPAVSPPRKRANALRPAVHQLSHFSVGRPKDRIATGLKQRSVADESRLVRMARAREDLESVK